MKILVIDDDAAVRKFISITLQRKKYNVIEADNGKIGLQLLQEHHDVSVMITDLIMQPQLTVFCFLKLSNISTNQ